MSIWHKKDLKLEDLAPMNINMQAHLDITYTELGEDYLAAKMPVDHRTQQPMGLLHGGASCVLAETVGSVASNLVVNWETHFAVGQSITANHLKSTREGWVFAVTKPVHLGRTSHLWQIEIKNQEGQILCLSHLTNAVLEKRK